MQAPVLKVINVCTRVRRQACLAAQVQANGHFASDAPSLPTRATAPATLSSRDASSTASLASQSSMLTAGSVAAQLPPKPVQVQSHALSQSWNQPSLQDFHLCLVLGGPPRSHNDTPCRVAILAGHSFASAECTCHCALQPQENGSAASQSSQQSTGLPASLVYRMSCEHFSRPLLVQQVCDKPSNEFAI